MKFSHVLATLPILTFCSADIFVAYSDPANGNVADGSVGYAYKQITQSYTAQSTKTIISILTRHDPRYFRYDDVYFGQDTNLLQNPGFETGSLPPWVLVGQRGLQAAAAVLTDGCHSGRYCLKDGAVGGIDGVAQAVTTIPGAVYSFSIWVQADVGKPALSRIIISSLDPPINLALATASDSGDSNSDRITNTNSWTITGSVAAGQVVTIYVNGTQAATGTSVLGDTFSISVNAAAYPYGLSAITVSTTAGGFESDRSQPLSVTRVPPGTYAITSQLVRRQYSVVQIAGSTAPQASRQITYMVYDAYNRVIQTQTISSDANGAYGMIFYAQTKGRVQIQSTDIAGNVLSTSVTFAQATKS